MLTKRKLNMELIMILIVLVEPVYMNYTFLNIFYSTFSSSFNGYLAV